MTLETISPCYLAIPQLPYLVLSVSVEFMEQGTHANPPVPQRRMGTPLQRAHASHTPDVPGNESSCEPHTHSCSRYSEKSNPSVDGLWTTTACYIALNDYLGNVIGLVDASDGTIAAAYEYDPFGRPLRETGSYAAQNPFRFSSQYTDSESGLVYFGFRYYHPQWGRFLNRDPIEELGGNNLYRFVSNDPVNRWDLLGLLGSLSGPRPKGTNILGMHPDGHAATQAAWKEHRREQQNKLSIGESFSAAVSGAAPAMQYMDQRIEDYAVGMTDWIIGNLAEAPAQIGHAAQMYSESAVSEIFSAGAEGLMQSADVGTPSGRIQFLTGATLGLVDSAINAASNLTIMGDYAEQLRESAAERLSGVDALEILSATERLSEVETVEILDNDDE